MTGKRPAIAARLSSPLLRPRAPSLAVGVVVAASFIVVETCVVVRLARADEGEAFGTLYLLGVLVVSTLWGRGLAVTTSVTSALVLAYFHTWPAGHFVPRDPQNGLVVIIFLFVALSTNFIAEAARARAAEADQRRREASVLAMQQAALRRVATLVARGARPSEVYSAVAEEIVRCLNVDTSGVWRYEADHAITLLAGYSTAGPLYLPVGERLSIDGDNLAAMVLRSGCVARHNEVQNATDTAIARIRELGIREGVAAPIVVDGRIWGLAIAATTGSEPMPPDLEERIGDFADLVATAIANAATRTELIASRARIVAAADDARRRLERDLHDGTQQHLVSLGLELRSAQASVPRDLKPVQDQLSDIVAGLTGVSSELQEISRGIHPAILAKGGLGPALRTLARRSPVPVTLDLAIGGRFAESVEVGAYYVVAEALTNAAKHARASEVCVCAETDDVNISLLIRDDGTGGADPCKGSGLTGLIDRVEALGGHMQIASPPGDGTTLNITIPLRQGDS